MMEQSGNNVDRWTILWKFQFRVDGRYRKTRNVRKHLREREKKEKENGHESLYVNCRPINRDKINRNRATVPVALEDGFSRKINFPDTTSTRN